MPIHKQRPQPKVGATFEKTFNGKSYSLSVVSTSSGIGFKVKNQLFDTPSAAAKSITGHAVNGWTFWKIG